MRPGSWSLKSTCCAYPVHRANGRWHCTYCECWNGDWVYDVARGVLYCGRTGRVLMRGRPTEQFKTVAVAPRRTAWERLNHNVEVEMETMEAVIKAMYSKEPK